MSRAREGFLFKYRILHKYLAKSEPDGMSPFDDMGTAVLRNTLIKRQISCLPMATGR
jgi:hypothetical protein